ncbi:uncharacterized protein LOC124887407 [Capsicum annuum]|uniref:uncharacterized protein LOC124887407 n=1 Tax=Capsicum annuum TaxID=4072 RepID=UPI001FB0FDBC|nr:uncharacterized protein LOC124887407 [Capsicum annuum]
MITIDEECNLEGTIVSVGDKEKMETSTFVAPVITVQIRAIRAPIEVEVDVPKPTITALVTRTPLNTKVVPWNYSTDAKDKGKGKFILEAAVAGMTRSGHCYALEGVAQVVFNKENSLKKVLIEAEVEDFWRKMPTKEYSVVEQLKKTSAQISLLSLLLNSSTHRSALVKVLNEAYVPTEMTSENLSALVGQVLEANIVSFHEDELPPEGLGHNRALNITVRCKDKFVSKFLIDNDSTVNICPFTTLRALEIDIGKVHKSNVKVKGFNGTQRGVIGEIDLSLQIGPVEFTVEFQVLDISASYNLLLERPWIYSVGAVPSTLHQTLKFVWDYHEIVIHGEKNSSIYQQNSVPTIERVEHLDGSIFHVKWTMCIAKVERLKLPRALMTVALEMLKNGFVPGQGLGMNLDGILEPIQLYEPTPEEVSSANLKRKDDILLPKPILFLDQSFSKAFVAQISEEDAEEDLIEGVKNLFITEEEEDAEEDLVGGVKNLFITEEEAECNMILEDCTRP